MSEAVPGSGLAFAGPDADDLERVRPKKAPNAFRTISEVADDLHIPQHVLRFWETKFPQVKPLKRGGGRRYYRPDDIALLRRISDLLYTQGYTIKGVQRLLREGGGRLSDDIPPPAPEEREAEVVPGESELALGDLDGTGFGMELHSSRGTRLTQAAADDAAVENRTLRAALAAALAELEALRMLFE